MNNEKKNKDNPAETQLIDTKKINAKVKEQKSKDNIKKMDTQQIRAHIAKETANKNNPAQDEKTIKRSRITNPSDIYNVKKESSNKNSSKAVLIMIILFLLAVGAISFIFKITSNSKENESNTVKQEKKLTPQAENALIKKVMEETKPVVNKEQPYFKTKGISFSKITSFTDKENEKFTFSMEEDRKTVALIEGVIAFLNTIDAPSIKEKRNIKQISEDNYKITIQNIRNKKIVKFYIDKDKYLFITNNQITKVKNITVQDITALFQSNKWTWEMEQNTQNNGYEVVFNNSEYTTNQKEIHLIHSNGCSFYSLNMNKEEIKNKADQEWNIFKRSENHNGEYVNIFKINDKNKNPLFFINEDKNKIKGFYIFSNIFRNNKGIKKGSSVKQCLILYPEISITCSPQGNTYLQLPGEDNVKYLIDKKYVNFKDDTVDEKAIIISIFVGDSPFLK